MAVKELFYVAFAVEYLSTDTDIGKQSLIAVFLQGPAAHVQQERQFPVREIPLSLQHGLVALHEAGEFMAAPLHGVQGSRNGFAVLCEYAFLHGFKIWSVCLLQGTFPESVLLHSSMKRLMSSSR